MTYHLEASWLFAGGKNRLEESPQNSKYTFDVFMCVSILTRHRDALFRCVDAAQVFEFVCRSDIGSHSVTGLHSNT